jgi:nucleoside-diphosphate-sugar epimerase
MIGLTGRSLAGTRVLVTGARGFLGAHLCPRLVAAGAKVAAVSRAEHGPEPDGVQWWRGDFEDFAQANALIGQVEPDIIFHLGGRVSAAPDLSFVLPTFHSLLTSTVNVLTLAARHPCRVVLVGSLEEPQVVAATDATPTSPYGAAKWAAGAYGRMFHQLYGCEVIGLRPFMTYGPRQAPDKIIPATILSLLRHEPPKLSSGRRPLDWVYVDDVIDGFIRGATAPCADGRTIDLGSGTAIAAREVVQRLVSVIDPSIEPRFGALPDRPDVRVRVADLEPAQVLLGWRPTTPLEEGLRMTIDWYRARHAESVGQKGLGVR